MKAARKMSRLCGGHYIGGSVVTPFFQAIIVETDATSLSTTPSPSIISKTSKIRHDKNFQFERERNNRHKYEKVNLITSF